MNWNRRFPGALLLGVALWTAGCDEAAAPDATAAEDAGRSADAAPPDARALGARSESGPADASAEASAALPDAGPDGDAGQAEDASIVLPPIAYHSYEPEIGVLGMLHEVRVTPTEAGNELSARWAADCEEPGVYDCGEAIPARVLSSAESAQVAAVLDAFPEERCWEVNPLATATVISVLDIDGEEYVRAGNIYETCDGFHASMGRLAALLGRLATPEDALEPSDDCYSPGEPTGSIGCPCDLPGQIVCGPGVGVWCVDNQVVHTVDTPHTRWVTVYDGPCVTPQCEGGEVYPDLESCLAVRLHCYRKPDDTYCSAPQPLYGFFSFFQDAP